MPRRIGFHVSIEGGFAKAVGRAIERRCTALQIFCGNPRGWEFQGRDESEVAEFRRLRAEADLAPLFAHACYLINICSLDDGVWQQSIARLSAELRLAAAIGADCYVLHPGSHKGESHDWGIARAAEALTAALADADSAPPLLLEGMASGHGPGGSFGTMGALIGRVEAAQLGIAIDSCHVFGAGYDLRHPAEVDRLAADIERRVGLARLGLIHVNDARDEPGARRDRHEHIGKGAIGRDGLRNLLNHDAFRHQPLILETPWVSATVDRRNLRAVLRLISN